MIDLFYLKIEHEESKKKNNWIEARIDLKVAHEVLYN